MRGSLPSLSRAVLYVMLAVRCLINSSASFSGSGFKARAGFSAVPQLQNPSIDFLYKCGCSRLTLVFSDVHLLDELLSGCQVDKSQVLIIWKVKKGRITRTSGSGGVWTSTSGFFAG